jgi:hypothetical protein
LNNDETVFDAKEELFLNSDYNFIIVENYVKPDQKQARLMSLIPGSSQQYKNQDFKGSLIRIGMGIALAATSTYELAYRGNRRDYDEVLADYRVSTNSNEATQLGNELSDLKEKMDRNESIRNISLLSAISIYGYNLLDGFLSKPKYGYRETKPIEFYLDSRDLSHLSGNLKINF